MARTVEDLALLYRIIAGPDEADFEVPPVPVGEMPDIKLKTCASLLPQPFQAFRVGVFGITSKTWLGNSVQSAPPWKKPPCQLWISTRIFSAQVN